MPPPEVPPPEVLPSEVLPSEADDPPSVGEVSYLERVVRKKLGLRFWERPALYRETAEAATDTDTPFWVVLLLSGAIATVGLTLDSTAVVIGAMLVAPLLGPLLGLSLSLAVGDGRLFVQTGATVLVGAAGIVALAALLTGLLPVHTITDEIASRTRPTTLDLAVAVFSGMAGAVVSASRETRLSASIPGVAVAVALVPPLGVAGFGIGAGMQWGLVRGSLLLFGANLAGIVLSGLLVYLLVGMHRADVLKAARAWHQEEHATGFARSLRHFRVVDRLRVLATPGRRVLLVLAFMAAVAVPLTTSFRQVLRELRVEHAVDLATRALEADDRAFVLGRDIAYDRDDAVVRLRVATEAWITEAEKDTLLREVVREAGEFVTLEVDQVLSSGGDLASLAEALPGRRPRQAEPEPALPTTLATARARLEGVLGQLVLPDSAVLVGGALWVGAGTPRLELAYGAPRRLAPEAEAMLARQATRALGLEDGAARVAAVPLRPQALPDAATAARWAALLDRYGRLRLQLAGDSLAIARAERLLRAGGAPAVQVAAEAGPPSARFRLAE